MVEGNPITNQELKALEARIDGQPFKLAVVPVELFVFLEKNARYMTHEMFGNLVKNINRDGGLTSVPFCLKRKDGKFLVLSGNHRVSAAIEAGVKEILVLYTDREMSRAEQVAIQLSHNSIEGKDDMSILKSLWDEIDSIDLKYYAGLDDKTLEEMEKLSQKALSEVDLEYKSLTFIFLQEEIERLDAVFERALSGVSAENIRVAKMQEFDRIIEATAKAKAAYGIKNTAVALDLVLSVFERHYEDLSDGWIDEEGHISNKGWVPVSSVIGTDEIPAAAAQVLRKAVDRMISKGDLSAKSKWQILEFLSADYLGGDNNGT